ncbi:MULTISPECIES: phosphonate metabolism protein/1,5-bisphosphokinase (PRPP-forming) PhnN [Marivita]|uniref:Ribose 1,5-bisphosphate phosphokinase PhnN n=1 Tax=Marivita cryptomonadis TaxID=505252 RepID=A0A9Q2S4H8_9RHOB|nr:MULTISPECIES: phosphonate metabolism protein/1,5-bisphosphokinase (PRPP-forming) PhnN [Marivita]MCR9166759.1 phosphonate metabolism protein/1,5-bisphosphokinase (PRPP-forming) PhnN [Paracoccaceae bacterium]MBM2321198.1 phosphonate metabolism protein/1,5-bisphosphokinase (PRPP-forming) PhnN [Marivita cryptomonadis]MBM2330779.1 phosphonate metabolism protein/1,5-bisphosphokinase (PRPP-forming) PhnN [Marivita cryptomonadis]MBM2340365.1 phosphonate metabolism protein/1,5-bisphosphokinase (PRPP-f
MNPGRLIAVVGPSGVGKDSVMAGMIDANPEMRLVRRTITRAPGLGGEDYSAVTQDAFDAAAQQGVFCVYWTAHGLSYGIPADVLTDVEDGKDCLANFSRGALLQAAEAFPKMIVLNITASPATLAKRLAGRGRETEAEIAARLAQADKALPAGLDAVTITNDGALEDTINKALTALQPARV